MKDPLRYFRIEAREIVEGLSRALLALERGVVPRDATVAELLRLAHTLKGAARVVKRTDIAEHAHALEDALEPHRGRPEAGTLPPAPPSSAQISALLSRVDAITALLDGLDPAPAETAAEAARAAPPELVAETTRVDIGELDALLDTLSEMRARMEPFRRGAADAEELGRQLRADGRALDADALRRSLGRMGRELTSALAEVDAELRLLAQQAHRLRLVPAATVFGPLERATRDAAQSLGRQVAFRARGGEVQLDGEVLAQLRGVLVHAVRNAVDHAIEPPEERRAAGKPEAGTVEVVCERRGYRVAITCRDDGRGIDPDAVRRTAERLGLGPLPDSDEAVLQLLFRPGMTTRAEVGAISGRGVGLDAVHDVAARLHGEAELRSARGQGTELRLLVPVSLSSMTTLLVEASGQVAGLPLSAVRRTLRAQPSDRSRSPTGEALLVGGDALPLLRLGRFLDPSASAAGGEGPFTAVVLEAEAGRCAVAVDRLRGTLDLVVRPLPRAAARVPALGASFDVDGTPQPVLDPEALVEAARRAPAPEASRPRERRVLVIDDSLTTRMLEQGILEAAGYTVGVAASAEDGLVEAGRQRYDLIVVDVEMPGMNGFELVARTREDPRLRDVPAIIVSSRGSDEDRRRGAEAGARGYLVKSEFVQQTFLELVRGLCE